jgi:HEXXH motif-containing protein
MDFAFAPSPALGQQLDAAVRARLAGSLDGIAATLNGALGADSDALGALTAAIRAHPIRPAVMCLYSELVPALFEDEDRARDILATLAMPVWREPAQARLVTVRDADLGAGIADCYRRQMNDDPAQLMEPTVLDEAALAEGRARVAAAMALLDTACPGMAGELAAVVNEVVLVGPATTPGAVSFHGASSFYLWGSLLLNIVAHPGRVRLVEGLAHEGGHCLLHGLTMGEQTVVNDTDERFASPLRDDKRPMDGLVHATFVLARMHMALAAVLDSGALTADERDEAATRLAAVRRDYAEGLAIVAAGARFTARGAAAFASAEAYMAEAAGISRPR